MCGVGLINKPKGGFILQSAEPKPFIVELLSTLTSIIQDLQLHQIHMFYEAVGLMISSEKEPAIREAYLASFQSQALFDL